MKALRSPQRMAGINSFLQSIYTLQDRLSLYGVVRDGLSSVIPGINVFIGEHDMENTLVTGCVVAHLFETPDFLPIVNGCAGEHPLWEPIRTGDQVVRVLSDHATAATWENTRLYKEALGLEGVRDHISIEFGDRHKRLVSIGVFRDRRGFSTQERELLAMLIPHLNLAMQNAHRIEELTADPNKPEIRLLLDMDGQMQCDAHELPRWFVHACGESRLHPQRLPAQLRGWIDAAIAQLNRGELETALPALRLKLADGTVELRLLRRRLEAGFVIHGQYHHAVPVLGLQALTARERDVLYWVREGKANADIASILGVGETTIKTHLKHIFEKLGVENRTAAARWLTDQPDQHFPGAP